MQLRLYALRRTTRTYFKLLWVGRLYLGEKMDSKAERSQRLETVVAILIAVVTVIGALVAWRSSVADDGAGDADFAGLRASVRAEETRALNSVDAYENYGAYMNYRRYNEMG